MGRNATAFETTQDDDFYLGAPRTPRRAPEPGYLDAERKPGTSRIQRRVELKFWPKLGQTGPENHFVTVSIKARYRQPRIYVVSGYFVVYLRSLPSYEGTTFVRSYLRTYVREGTTFVRSYLRTYVREGTTFVRSYLRTYLPPIKYVHTNEGIFYIFKVRRYGKYEGRLRRYEGRYERRYEGMFFVMTACERMKPDQPLLRGIYLRRRQS